MARVQLTLPEHLPFSTEITLSIRDINYGGHMGNEVVLSLAHEARIRYLASLGFSELDVAGVGMIMSDCAVIYQAEAFRGDVLRVDVGAGEFSRCGCDLFYRITRLADQKPIAMIKTGIVFFNYAARKVEPVPVAFLNQVQAA